MLLRVFPRDPESVEPLEGLTMRKSLLSVLGLAILFAGCEGNPNSSQPAPAKSAYVLPSELFIKTTVSRGVEGEVYVHGSTNLPDGLNIAVELTPGKPVVGDTVTVKDGRFTTGRLMTKVANRHYLAKPGIPPQGNSRYIDVPLPAGKTRVHYGARFHSASGSFNSALQRPEVIAVVGEEGKNLRGKMFKLTDPGIVDSPKELDFTSETVYLPPLTPEAEAINLIKRAVLTTDFGKSSTDIDQNIEFNMAAPGYHRGPGGWSAKPIGNSMYEVSFDLITDDAQGHHQAIWSANLTTRQVKIVNMAAKYLSWTPNY